MALYLVTLPTTVQHTLKDGVSAMIVAASSTDAAKLAAAAYLTGDTPWSQATATALVDTTTIATASALHDWRFTLTVHGLPTGGTADFVVVGGPTTTNDTIDKVGASLATLLNAHADIANAAYNATTQILTVASGSGGDDLGDLKVSFKVQAPIRTAPGGQISGDDDLSAAFVDSITDEGVSTDALTIEFLADTTVLPKVLAVGKMQ